MPNSLVRRQEQQKLLDLAGNLQTIFAHESQSNQLMSAVQMKIKSKVKHADLQARSK